MFKVVVIDDEPLIARDIKNSIESADQEFQVIGTATDGSSGLNMIRELKPDLVFVDICMPVLTGLELIATLRKEGNMTPTVILSGYQEFDYAKKAISLEVLDYLVKPLNPLNLKKFFEQLKVKLSLNQYEQRRQRLETIFHYNTRNDEKVALFDAGERFFLTKICFGSFNFFRNNQFAPVYSYTNMISLNEICDQIWGKFQYWMIDGKYENELLLITVYKERNDTEKIQKLYDNILEKLNKVYYVTFVSSEMEKAITDLRKELILLESHLYHKSIFGKSNYITAKTAQDSNTQESAEHINYEYIAALVIKKKKSELLETIEKILVNCKENNYTQANLIRLLKNLMCSCCPKEAADEIDFMMNLIVVNALDYETLHRKIYEAILEYSDINDNSAIDDASAKYIVYMVQEYLDKHYQEKVLIQSVADKFGFNCSYLCHLFRKQKEVSPNEYIIMKRIDMAKKLLKMQTNLNIKEVASIVGYEDQYYFSRLFKTYVGASPTDFRKEQCLEV